MMKAAVLTGHGELDNLQFVDNLTVPDPQSDEVRIKMKVAALNRLDLFVRQGWKGLHLDFPHVICADGAGVVDAVGDSVTHVQVGDAVSIDPTLIPTDSPARFSGLENQSRDMAILGEHHQGVAAEYVVLPQRNLVKMPSDFDFAEAAAAGLVYVTAWHSLMTRGGLRAGETVLIVGAGGGVNSASIQIAKLAGASVTVIGSNEEKCQLAQELGADVTVNREETPEWSRALYKMTDKRGFDVVVDNVGEVTFADSIRSTCVGGRLLVVGATTGPFPKFDLRQLFARQINIIGSTMGPHRDYVDVMKLVFAGKLKAVIGERFSLSEAQAAQAVLEKGDTFGKIVLTIDG